MLRVQNQNFICMYQDVKAIQGRENNGLNKLCLNNQRKVMGMEGEITRVVKDTMCVINMLTISYRDA